MGACLYWDCSAGISGDMAVASLLDLGADEGRLRAALASLPIDGYTIEITRVLKSGIEACDFAVELENGDTRDHDMAYLHGGESPTPVPGAHDHRNLADVVAIIDGADLSERARDLAHRIFRIIAEAEASVHGVPVDQIHFHEVGAIDSIVDIVAVAVLIDDLAIDEVYVPRLTEGQGMIRCRHGLIPIPAPATAAIAQAFGLPLGIAPIEGELVTPTGAAIVAALRTPGPLPETFTIERVGMGAGKRAYPTTGVLRALLIKPA